LLVAILQFELHIHDASSLKDKRRVVRSLKDRLHREHQCSVAEVGLLDQMGTAQLGLALVGSDARHLGATLDSITLKIRAFSHEAELGDTFREIITNGSGAQPAAVQGAGEGGDGAEELDGEAVDTLAQELTRRIDSPNE